MVARPTGTGSSGPRAGAARTGRATPETAQGTAPPRRANNRRGLRTREEILDAAARLMAERGYAATSLSTLSQQAGLPKSAIYHHFASKEALLSEVMASGARQFFAAMVSAQQDPPEGSAQDRLAWLLHRTAEAFAPHEDFLRLFLHLTVTREAIDSPEVALIMTDVRSEGRRHMRRMVEIAFEGGPGDVDAIAEELSYFGIAGFDGAFIGAQVEPVVDMTARMTLLAEAMARIGSDRAGVDRRRARQR